MQPGFKQLGATGRLGTGGIDFDGTTFVQLAGGVIPSQAATVRGSTSVTLAGANTLTTLTFDNNGGTSPTLIPTGTLTLTTGLVATSMNVNSATVSTLGAGNLVEPPAETVELARKVGGQSRFAGHRLDRPRQLRDLVLDRLHTGVAEFLLGHPLPFAIGIGLADMLDAGDRQVALRVHRLHPAERDARDG